MSLRSNVMVHLVSAFHERTSDVRRQLLPFLSCLVIMKQDVLPEIITVSSSYVLLAPTDQFLL